MYLRKIWLVLAFVLLFFLMPTGDSSAAEIKQGYPAPNFELSTLDGKTVELKDYKGKKVILNFWASWCAPCRTEMPVLQKFYDKKNEEVVLLSVNLTKEDKSKDTVKKFVSDKNLTFPIPLDERGEVSDLYQVISLPTTYFIDKNGILKQKVIGPLNLELLKELLSET